MQGPVLIEERSPTSKRSEEPQVSGVPPIIMALPSRRILPVTTSELRPSEETTGVISLSLPEYLILLAVLPEW
jgi:hypothetical protein